MVKKDHSNSSSFNDSNASVSRDMTVDFQEHERNELLTGEPRYQEDEIRNANFALVFGILAFLFSVVALILQWILYYREPKYTFCWHGIWLIFVVLFCLAVIGWGFMAKKAVRMGRQPSPFFTGFIFIVGLIMIGYLLIEALWLIFYKPIHYNYLVALQNDRDEWDKRMVEGSSLEDGWKQSRRMMWWTTFFTVGTAICLCFAVYAARSIIWNRYNLTRLTLYVALGFIMLSAWLMIYWIEESLEYNQALPEEFIGNLLLVMRIIAIICIIYAILTAIVNVLQTKIGYFLMGALGIVLFVIMVCSVGVLLRKSYNGSFKDIFVKGNCAATMTTIHENNFSDFCDQGKYLPAGSTGSKYDLVNRWEDNDSKEKRLLNPACCANAKDYYLKPFTQLGYWALVATFALGVAIACLFYLAETNDYLSGANKKIGPVDFAGLAIVFLIFIIMGIYFWARPANKLDYKPNPSGQSFADPENNKIEGWDIVPESIIKGEGHEASTTQEYCIPLKGNSKLPTFETDNSKTDCASESDCYIRVAFLTKNVVLKTSDLNGAQKATFHHKGTYFPDCISSQENFIEYFGTKDQISGLLQNTKACSKDFMGETELKIYKDQVLKSKTESSGKYEGEVEVHKTPSQWAQQTKKPAGSTCGDLYTSTSCSGGKCQYHLNLKRSLVNTIKGRLYYTVNGAKKLDIHENVFVYPYYNGKRLSEKSALYEDGLFTLDNVPVDAENDYIAQVKVTDKKGVFLEKTVDVLIPADYENGGEISAGNIRLITKSGAVCKVTDTNCINSQKFSKGNIKVSVRSQDDETDPASPEHELDEVKISLLKGKTIDLKNKVKTYTSGKTTKNFNIADQPFGAYSILAAKKGYKSKIVHLDLQETNHYVQPIYLSPTNSSYDMKIASELSDTSVDFDLIVDAATDNGKTCEISPYNKYCAYGAHLNDIIKNNGVETIVLKKLAIANYMSYLQPSPAYANTCPAGTPAHKNPGDCKNGQPWNWGTVKNSKSLNGLKVKTSTTLKGDDNKVDSQGRAIGLIAPENLVETDEEARLKKTILNKDGTVLQTLQKGSTFRNVENTGAHAQGGFLPSLTKKGGDFMLISCFTGFGGKSLLKLNTITKTIPKIAKCISRLNNDKPNHTLGKLRSAFDLFMKNKN